MLSFMVVEKAHLMEHSRQLLVKCAALVISIMNAIFIGKC